ncbi:hypothetical protein F4803DRAFT_550641 [Xylaria telfairii]|nr:hypothetical protein F4803DRAFT_550641 [Xylaria telfairii]
MAYKRDSLAGSGHLTIVVTMIIFVSLLLILWTLMALQILGLREQYVADLEKAAKRGVGPIDGDVPLEDVLQTQRYTQSSWASSTATQQTSKGSSKPSSKSNMTRDSQWYREERPFRYFLYRAFGVFKNDKKEASRSERGSDTANIAPELGYNNSRV